MKKIIICLVLWVLSFSVFSSPAAESTKYNKITINVGTTAVIEKAEAGEYAYDMIASGFAELPLVSMDANGVYHPLVAEFESADSKTWSYKIVPGLTWSDGTLVTAEDILFTLCYDDENGSANFVDQVDSKGNTTKSKYTSYELSEDNMEIKLTLRNANIRELSNMASFRIVPSHLYSDGDITQSDKRTTCGPFVFSSFDSLSGTINFVVNKYYPNKPNVDEITIHLFGSEDTMYMALSNGDIDFTFIYNSGVSSTYVEALADNENLAMISNSTPAVPLVLAFNNSSSKLSDVNLRKAISYILDYSVIAKYVGGPNASVANRGFVPRSTLGYKETEKLCKNLELAESYMNKAGYQKINGVYQKDGNALQLSLSYRLDKSAQVAGAELIKTQLEEFGIVVVLDGLDSASYNAKTSNKFSNNNITFEMALFGYTAAGMGMGSGLGTIYVDKSHSVQGGCQVDDSSFVDSLNKLSKAQTITEYCTAASDIQDFYALNTPLIALYHDNFNYLVSSKYCGYQVDSLFGINNVNTYINLERK